MAIKIVLVRTLYEENIGLAARACANFSVKDLALVKPECDWKSVKAKSRAMHGGNVLLKAKQYKTLEGATADCLYSVATSARKGKDRKPLKLPELAEMACRTGKKIALVFGPEPSGLSNSEILECDFVATIPASKSYPVLNLSHAVAVVLSAIFREKEEKSCFDARHGGGKPEQAEVQALFDSRPETRAAVRADKKPFDARPETRKRMLGFFSECLGLVPGIDNRPRVFAAFRALTSRALLSEKEARALTAFFGKGRIALKGKRETPNGLKAKERPGKGK